MRTTTETLSSPADPKQLDRHKNSNTFAGKNAPYLLRNIEILASQELRTGFDDRYIAAKATISLCKFQTRIAPADHDQVSRQIIKLQNLYVRERLGRLQARNVWNCRMRSDVEENLVGRQLTGASVVQTYFKGFRRDKMSGANDELGAARLVDLQVLGNLTLDHLALAPANHCHIDGDGIGHGAVFAGLARDGRNLRACNLVLGRHAGGVGTGAADPSPLDHCRFAA